MKTISGISQLHSLTRRAKASARKRKSVATRIFNCGLWTLLLAFFMVVGCDTRPILYSEDVPEVVDKPSVAAAAVQALQTRGYTIALINETTGTVTTEWTDVTGVMGHIFEVSTRKRVMVSVSLDGRNVSVQMTKQERTETMGWRNDVMSRKDKREAQRILEEILESLQIYQ
jgi:hypothetical protein